MIDGIVSFVNGVSGGNQMIAGALMLTLSGSALYLAKELPKSVFELLKKTLTTTLTINNGAYENEQLFLKISSMMNHSNSEKSVRTLSVDTCFDPSGSAKVYISFGYGFHIMRYGGELLFVKKNKLEKVGTYKVIDEISMTKIGRSHSIFNKMVAENSKDSEEKDKISILTFKDKKWSVSSKEKKRPSSSLAIDEDVFYSIDSHIDYFINNKSEYDRLGLNYKTSFILHGKTGTGKTSIIKSIASDRNMNLCVININSMSDRSFSEAIISAPANSIILIEDFDSSSTLKIRDALPESEKLTVNDDVDSYSPLTLTGVLNTLDGVSSLNGNIVFMTTNHLEKIDSAVYRSGRIDVVTELPDVSSESVKRHFERLYGDMSNVDFSSMRACEINRVIFSAKSDKDKACELINQYSAKKS